MATKTTKTSAASNKQVALLTEEEILKMGEKDYMNEAQLAFFKARLQQLEKDLLKNADETTEHLRETVLVPDPADRATIEEEHALELRTRDRERKLLKKVQQSIALIDAGEYGWCEETGEPIGVARLLARPTANLSLEAQQRRELKQKLYGDWSLWTLITTQKQVARFNSSYLFLHLEIEFTLFLIWENLLNFIYKITK